ncbi:hypothetical protein F5Y16DRAFT_350855 [Xylariaceae sp. FL0255]|nr:hypothetical protein F5Y16DRAFT_350855 [Xylariaceae sp. FL0255]
MTSAEVAEPRSEGVPRSRGTRPRGSRSSRGRGNRQRGGQAERTNDTARELMIRHAQVPQNATPPAVIPDQSAPGSSQDRGGGRSRGRSRRGTRASTRGPSSGRQRTTIASGRTFGGNLTTEPEPASPSFEDSGNLNAGASVFVPGRPFVASTSQAPAASRPARRGSKSVAPDLPTRIHEDISNGQYECVICTNEVLRNSRIWSCSICWTVTHMSCVKKWYSNRPKPTDQEQQSTEQPTWRCPGCNSTVNDEPGAYHCWCGKEINPKSIAGLDPHSCGQTCSKPRGTCPHPCPLLCHAGPCPPCLLMGPSQSCFCGKNVSTKRCGQTDYTTGWSCHEVCGDLLACGEHECQRECHPGLCGRCETLIASYCYCGQEHSDMPCDEREELLESYNHGQVSGDLQITPQSWFTGSFKCQRICGRPFDCDNHDCQQECHPQDEYQAHCPQSPDVVTHCPCGKTPISDMNVIRETCLDPIPNCGKVCNKDLGCGHFCQDTCHSGTCSPCTQPTEIDCRCGRTKSKTACHQGDTQHPECMKICRAQLNCGRHEHGERCCPGEKRALERIASKRKNKNIAPANEEFEAEHICVRICGRELKCGKHYCHQMCHRGPCPSCLEAVFEEISCTCGRTVLQPPQPCGTQPPQCRFDCTRVRPCGHPQVDHYCHPDDLPCPKCPFLVEKRCVCGKKSLKNQPCWFEEPRCGLPCGKKLKCGTHLCTKLCHRPGECEDEGIAGSHCRQSCGKTRNCGHLDTEQCHAPYPCKEDKPCQAKTFVTCECQHRKQEVKCLATKTNPSPQRSQLKCDDECLRLQRNARLASALNIDPQTHTDDHIPYSETTIKLYKENPQWAQTYEREYRVFAADPLEKRLRFKPMKPHQRAFLHSLAEDFGLDSESSDPEPHRHVCLFKTPRFVSSPLKTLAQCVKIQAGQDALKQQTSLTDDITAAIPYNALLLTNPRFGLTIEELDAALKKEYAAYPALRFGTSFLPSGEVVIKGSGSWTAQTLEASMSALKPTLSQTIRRLKLADDVFLCSVDDSLNVLRREKGPTQTQGGWNAVAGRSAARPKSVSAIQPSVVPLRSKFVALKKESKKKIEEEPVEDDWEAAAEKMDDVVEEAEATA